MTKQTTMFVVIMRAQIGAIFVAIIVIRRQNPKLARGVSKEANFSLAILTILASFSSIPRRVQPTLKNPM